LGEVLLLKHVSRNQLFSVRSGSGVGDRCVVPALSVALAFLPILAVGVQKLRGAPTNCFIAGTLVAVAGVVAGTSTADAGPSSASKPIEEIQVGDFVWARDEHDRRLDRVDRR